jgi:hypothetical protein
VFRSLTVSLLALALLAGCAIKTEIVASKYVRSQLITAAQGGTITVTQADSTVLAGTQVIIPAHSLSADTVITIGLIVGSIAPAGVQTAGPLVDLGPNDATFDPPATVTLPLFPSDGGLEQLVVDALESNGQAYRIDHAQLVIDGGLVSFAVDHFTRFEPDIIRPGMDAGPGDGGDGGEVADAGCMAGLSLCPFDDGGAVCVDLTADVGNCGHCGVVCAPGAMCVSGGVGGTCICDTSQPDGGDLLYCNAFCVHSNTDPLNCGVCNNPCETGICINGACLCDPDAGIERCSLHGCANLNVSLKNCGACGNDCTLNDTLSLPQIVCVGGQCLCAGGQNDICFSATDFPSLVCTNTAGDPKNCGGCGLSDAGPLPDGAVPSSPHVCGGVQSVCENGSCICPGGTLYCAAGTWIDDAGASGGMDSCVNDNSDRLNCGGCGRECDQVYAADASCQYAKCACLAPQGICVVAHDPVDPTCDCSGFQDGGGQLIACNNGLGLSYSRDIFPLLGSSSVTNESWGVLVGCAVSGCHDSTAAAGLAFVDPDASYQGLVNAPSQVCAGQWLAIPGYGDDSLLTQLLEDSYQCPNPIGGTATPMPIDDGGIYHPLSPCLVAQIREWIDQGMAY